MAGRKVVADGGLPMCCSAKGDCFDLSDAECELLIALLLDLDLVNCTYTAVDLSLVVVGTVDCAFTLMGHGTLE